MKKKIILSITLVLILLSAVTTYVLFNNRKTYKIERVEYQAVNNTPVYWNVVGYNSGLKKVLQDSSIDLSNITKIVFNNVSATGNTVTSSISLDLSKENDGTVKALVADDTLYIQYNGILYLNSHSAYLFAGFKDVISIEGLEYINTSSVTYMRSMFSGMNSLTSLDLRSFDTSNVTNMSGMFYDMSSLTSLDLSNFDTRKVTNMDWMFNYVSSLTELDISSFNTSNVTDMSYMFAYMESLTELDLSHFDTSSVTDMSYMFASMSSITELNLSSFNTSNVTDMSFMFGLYNGGGGMDSLTKLNLSNFNTSKVTNMNNMFRGMSSVTELDISSFNTSNVTDMSYMFASMSSITELNLSIFDTSNVTDMSGMFAEMGTLTELDISNFDTGSVTDMSLMFYRMHSLVQLDLSSFDTGSVTDMTLMFASMSSIEKIYVSDKFITSLKAQNIIINTPNLTGWNGSNYSSIRSYDKQYARIDTPNNPGYFSVKVTSDKYDMDKGYIYIGNNLVNNEIINDIDTAAGTETIENNKYNIYVNDELGKSYDIVNVQSNKYDLSKDYIYIGAEEFDIEEVAVANGTKEVSDNKLYIKYEDEVIDQFDIVSTSSDKYDLSKDYIYTGTEQLDLQSINVINGTKETIDNKLYIKYGEEQLNEYPIITLSSGKYEITDKYIHSRDNSLETTKINSSYPLTYITSQTSTNQYLIIKYNGEEVTRLLEVLYSSDDYDLSKDYIYVGNGVPQVEDIVTNKPYTTQLDFNITNNKLVISKDDYVFRNIDIVSISSDKYDLSEDHVYTGSREIDLESINVTNGTKEVSNNKLYIKYGDTVLATKDIYSINFGEIKTLKGKVVILEDMFYEDFINNITPNRVTYKIYDGETEVTEGTITEGMKVKVYIDEELVDEYEVTNEYLEIDESLNIDEGIIEDLTIGQTIEEILSNISTSGTVKVLNGETEVTEGAIGTGYKVVIELSNETIEYELSVKGDVTGTGKVTMADVMKTATHMLEGNVIEGNCYLKAADVTGDGNIRMSDVMKIANYVLEGGTL